MVPLTLSNLWKKIKKLIIPWLIVSVLVCGAVLGVLYLNREESIAKAVVVFSFEGVEKGLDPLGNLFDAQEIKSAAMIQGALEALQMDADADTVERVQKGLAVYGYVPSGMIAKITEHKSIYESNTVEVTSDEKISAYNPTQYTVAFDYAKLNYSVQEGKEFLRRLLEEYQGYFYAQYGYNKALDQYLAAKDYANLDYDITLEALSIRVEIVGSYLDGLNKNYRSKVTGYSFADLYAISTDDLANDIQSLKSFVEDNNVTKSYSDYVERLSFSLETQKRDRQALIEQLDFMNAVLAEYRKQDIVIGVTNEFDSDEGEKKSDILTVSETSSTYDDYVQQSIILQQEIADYDKIIRSLEQRIGALQGSSGEEDIFYVENELERVENKVNGLLEAVRNTAEDYYENSFKNAFQVVSVSSSTFSLKSFLLNSLSAVIFAEIAVLGAFIALAAILAAKEHKPGKGVSAKTQSVVQEKEAE